MVILLRRCWPPALVTECSSDEQLGWAAVPALSALATRALWVGSLPFHMYLTVARKGLRDWSVGSDDAEMKDSWC